VVWGNADARTVAVATVITSNFMSSSAVDDHREIRQFR
jgi:hypothetical protein